MKHLFSLTLLLLTPFVAVGQVTRNAPVTIDGKTQYVQLAELTVTPQKLPVPALKYKLTWGFDQRVKNNAAIQYNFAMRELAQMRHRHLESETRTFEEDYARLFTDSEFFEEKKAEHFAFEEMLKNLSGDAPKNEHTLRFEASLGYKPFAYSWHCSIPTHEFPVEEAREFVNRFRSVYRYLETGSRCDHCDWEYHIRGNKNVIAVLLPEAQECRDLARGLMVKARFEIREKNYAEAIQTIRVGKTLARHAAEGCPFIVGALIGIAIDSMMNECLLELVQQPDAPNLYWTLTAMPNSPFSYYKALDVEMDFLRLVFPEVARAMDDPESMTENDWKNMNNDLVKQLSFLVQSYSSLSADYGLPFEMLPFLNGLWGIAAYPKAKEWLASQGKTVEEIEAMPVAKVIGLWSIDRFEIFRDEYRKTVSLPSWQKRKFNADERWDEFETITPLDAMVRRLFPAMSSFHQAISRLEASGDVLRIVEAVRLYAAENDGRLPETLDAIESVPIPPVDPFTGKPYTYRIENGRGVVEFDPGYGNIRRTEIQFK